MMNMMENEMRKIYQQSIESVGISGKYLGTSSTSTIRESSSLNLNAFNQIISKCKQSTINLFPLKYIELPLFTITNKPLRYNKNKRIQKKWIKKYGYQVKSTPRNTMYIIGDTLIGHPEAIRKIKEEIQKQLKKEESK